MDRLEILKLALASSPDARKALELAHQMAEFVAGNQVAEFVAGNQVEEPLLAPKPERASFELTIAPRPAALGGRLSLIAPGVRGRKVYTSVDPQHLFRHARAWSDEERKIATDMLDSGATFVDVAQVVSRTPGAIEKSWRIGMFPTKIQPPVSTKAEK